MAAKGAERQVKDFGGLFLRWSSIEVRVIQRPVVLSLTWGTLKHLCGFPNQPLQCGDPLGLVCRRAAVLEHETRLQQRIAAQCIGPSQVLQCIPNTSFKRRL